MCGIVDFLSRNEGARLEQEKLSEMRDTMWHRGPDDSGTELFDSGKVGLAHRRLAIMDLSPAGHEPMPYANNRYWLTYNGEIYNAAALRKTLRASGYQFRSSCDADRTFQDSHKSEYQIKISQVIQPLELIK